MGQSKDARKVWGGRFWIRVQRLWTLSTQLQYNKSEEKEKYRYFNGKKEVVSHKCPCKNEVGIKGLRGEEGRII